MARRKLCNNFAKTGQCRFGDRCKFAHGTNDTRPAPPPEAPDPLQQWKYKLPLPDTTVRPTDLASFFNDALQFIKDGDYEVVQKVFLHLASYGGIIRIQELLDSDRQTVSSSFLEKAVLPFFETLTHPNVQRSPLLETAVVTVCNTVYGPHGDRTAWLFNGIVQASAGKSFDNPTTYTGFRIVIDALYQICLHNGGSNVHPEIRTISEILIHQALLLTTEADNIVLEDVRKTADKLNRHMKLGREIPSSASMKTVGMRSQATFEVRQDPPGGRHDNDHADIIQIKVLPTFGEIQSSTQEYLPAVGQSHSGLSGYDALLDRQFRLVREDTVGQLRDAIRLSLQTDTPTKVHQGPRTNVYNGVHLIDVAFLRNTGVVCFVRFNQPLATSRKDKLKEWWERSKRLLPEALVCLTDVGGSHVFCTVVAQGRPAVTQQSGRQPSESPSQIARLEHHNGKSLTSIDGAYLSLRSINTGPNELTTIISSGNYNANTQLVEFPGVLLPAFQPTLVGLQKLMSSQDMAFIDIVSAGSAANIAVPAPAYSRTADFNFDLACLTESKEPLLLRPNGTFDLDRLLARSTLDYGQAEALLHCLRSSLASVQGPPGTGKSFTGVALIKVLLAVQKKASLGPIVCVCFTNHALDQLLEHLHDNDVTQIVRVGSRSKSEVLENVNLRKVVQQIDQTPSEKRSKWELNQALDKDVKEASSLLDKAYKAHYVHHVREYLQAEYPHHHRELFKQDALEDGWQRVETKKLDPLRKWVQAGDTALNVLLSRAKHGMYIIGNTNTASSVGMWSNVVDILRNDGLVGTALSLQCPRHPETPILVSSPNDFTSLSPEAGCGRLCDKRLLCGHSCPKKCHSTLLHNAVYCLESCPRSIPGCDHSCPNDCGSPCVKRCAVILTDSSIILSCGHELTNPTCWQKQHPELVSCKVTMQKEVPRCKHIVQVPCYVDVQAASHVCKAPCASPLACGHACNQACYRCYNSAPQDQQQVQQHAPCKQPCGRAFNACEHACLQPCHGDEPCQPCDANCGAACPHSKCDKKCHEPCAPCAERNCATSCPHNQCTLPCAAPCDWLPCSKRCTKHLLCGHQCPSLCGETCPEAYCQTCASDDVRQQVVDMLEMKTFEEIDLEEPCIIAPCGHILTVTSMDGTLSFNDYYDSDAAGQVTTIKQHDIDLSNIKVPGCPTCRSSLRSINRYSRIVRQASLAEATKRFTTWSHMQYIPLAQSVGTVQEELAASSATAVQRFAELPAQQVELVVDSTSNDNNLRALPHGHRYDKILKLYRRIAKFFADVKKEEQPFQRVWDLVQHKRRVQGSAGQDFEFDSGVLQTRQQMLAVVLLQRCQLAVLSDFVNYASNVIASNSEVDFGGAREVAKHVVNTAISGKQQGIEAEAHLLYARFCAIEQVALKQIAEKLGISGGSATVIAEKRDRMDTMKLDGKEHVNAAQLVCDKAPGSTAHLTKQVEDVKKMLEHGTLSDVLLPQEMKAIYDAMAREFRGTGHWYTCQNGHLFTVGECGMPMQLARCPQCGANVGGQSHRPAAGVSRADDLERQMANMRV